MVDIKGIFSREERLVGGRIGMEVGTLDGGEENNGDILKGKEISLKITCLEMYFLPWTYLGKDTLYMWNYFQKEHTKLIWVIIYENYIVEDKENMHNQKS